MKATKKLIPAIAMLVISALITTSATYAWFTMSREVTATGMNVTVTAPDNLLIKATGDPNFTAVGTATAQAGLKVYPASSINGVNVFNVKQNEEIEVDGQRKTDTELEASVAAAGTTAGGYVDFTFELKTDSATAVNVGVKSFEVRRNSGGTDDGIKAVRAAILTNATTPALDTGVTNAVLLPAGASYFTTDKAVASLGTGNVATLGDVAKATISADTTVDTTKVITVPENGTPKSLVIRVWLEGEDEQGIIASAAALDFNVTIVLRDIAYVAPTPSTTAAP